jgi:predicted nuclease of predicted toxin-antitoxin system
VRWLADECVHADVVGDLRRAGHDVLYAAEVLRQTEDADLADEALRDGRILLAEDKDFGDLAFLKMRATPSIVLLRFSTARRALKSPCLLATIAKHGDAFDGNLTVIDERGVRQRPLERKG